MVCMKVGGECGGGGSRRRMGVGGEWCRKSK